MSLPPSTNYFVDGKDLINIFQPLGTGQSHENIPYDVGYNNSIYNLSLFFQTYQTTRAAPTYIYYNGMDLNQIYEGIPPFTVTDLSYNTYTSGLYTVLQLQNNNPIPPTNLSMIPPLNATGSVTFNNFPTTINYAAVSGGASGDFSVSRLSATGYPGTSIGGLGGTVVQDTITHNNSLGSILSITVGGAGLTANNYTVNPERYPGGNTNIYYGAQSIVNISGASGFNSNTIASNPILTPQNPPSPGAPGTLTSVPSATPIYLGGGGGNGNDGAGGVGGGGAGGTNAGSSYSNGLPGTANTGGGGGGASLGWNSWGGNGGTGTVYLWWLT